MKTNYSRNQNLDLRYGDGTYTKPVTVYCALFSVAPTVSTPGTELSGNGYARVAVTNNATNFPDAVAGAKSNGVALTFPEASGAVGTATHFGYFDASTAGNLLDFNALTTSKVYGVGDTPSFGVGQLTFLET